MKRTLLSALVFLAVTVLAPWCTQIAAASSGTPKVVATTTLIESAVRDLMGQGVEVIRLLPPGSCPGHFDMEPQQVAALATASLFVRHDYQAGLDAGVKKAGLDPKRVVSLTSLPAFTIPGNYVALCAELNARLAQEWPERESTLNQQLQQIKDRAIEVERDIHCRMEHLRGHRVLCARYQKDFCEWIGLRVAASFHAGTDESAWQLNRAVDRGKTARADAVIGNLQWGPRHLAALSEATGLPGIMLSNFPENGNEGAYWLFVERNVNALLEGFHDAGH